MALGVQRKVRHHADRVEQGGQQNPGEQALLFEIERLAEPLQQRADQQHRDHGKGSG
ncbi:hypothetical protein D3C78_1529740 [compost metagenome]